MMNGSARSSGAQRYCFLDALRIAAAFGVVVFHVLGSSVHNDPSVSLQLQGAVSRIKALLEWPVPIFFMITGFLWLHPGKTCTYAKIMPHVRRFILALFTVGYAYALMERVFNAGGLSAQLFLLALGDVFTGNLWDHMWYLYAAVGVYLALPVIKPFFDTQPSGSILLAAGLLWVFTVLAPVLEEACGYLLPVAFPLTGPLFYLFAGGVLARFRPARKAALPADAGLLLCLWLLYTDVQGTFSPLLNSLAAVCLFVFAAGLFADQPDSGAVRIFAECTFGVYLFQQFFINVMIKLLHIYPLRFSPVPAILLSSLCIFLLSFLITFLLRKLRWIRKFLL